MILFFNVQYSRVRFWKTVRVNSFGEDPNEQKRPHVYKIFCVPSINVEKFWLFRLPLPGTLIVQTSFSLVERMELLSISSFTD